MSKAVSPIPYKVPIADANGNLSPVWGTWFRDLFDRIGGLSASSNTELNATLTSATSSITTNAALVTSLTARVTALENNLSQGPIL